MRKVTCNVAAQTLEQLLDAIEDGGDEVVITRDSRAVAKLVRLATVHEPAVSGAEAAPDDGESLAWVPARHRT